MSDKLEILKKELVDEIKKLATDLSHTQSFVGLLSYEGKFNALHEKFVNLKFLERKHLGLDIFDSPIPMEDTKPEVFSVSEERFVDEQAQEYIFDNTSSVRNASDENEFDENVMDYSEDAIEKIEEREDNKLDSKDLETSADKVSKIDGGIPDEVDDFSDFLPKHTLPKIIIDFNDRLAFLNQLFDGDQQQMDSTINTLNHMNTLSDAKSYLKDLGNELNWSDKSEYLERLLELTAKRFDG